MFSIWLSFFFESTWFVKVSDMANNDLEKYAKALDKWVSPC